MATCTRIFGTFANDATVGTVAVTDPANASASDDARTNWALTPSAVGQYLKCTNSSHSTGTALQSGDTITQIDWVVERSTDVTAGAIRDNLIRTVVGGAIQASPSMEDTATDWPSSDTDKTYSQTTSLPTADQVLASDWGLVISPKETGGFASKAARVDYVRANITFTVAAVAQTPNKPFPGLPPAVLTM